MTSPAPGSFVPAVFDRAQRIIVAQLAEGVLRYVWSNS